MTPATRISGAGRPVVILPWFGLDSAVAMEAFEPVFHGIAGWRRIYIDLPGTGRSPAVLPCSDAVLHAVGDTVAATVGKEPVLVAGCSYGGYLAAALARRHPGPVAGLLLVCAGGKIRPEERDLGGVPDPTPDQGWLDGVPHDLHDHLRHAIARQSKSVADRVVRALLRNGPTDARYLETLRSSGYALSNEDAVGNVDGPVTVLAGRGDRIAGYRDQFNLVARFPRGHYLALADSGHYLPFEQPELFALAAREWLARAASPSERTIQSSHLSH
jgi:pimeloyl-ACP methyl ester carboxylesterase